MSRFFQILGIIFTRSIGFISLFFVCFIFFSHLLGGKGCILLWLWYTCRITNWYQVRTKFLFAEGLPKRTNFIITWRVRPWFWCWFNYFSSFFTVFLRVEKENQAYIDVTRHPPWSYANECLVWGSIHTR